MNLIYKVKFRSSFDSFNYDFGNINCNVGEKVLCKTKHGLEIGTVIHKKIVEDDDFNNNSYCKNEFVRLTSDADLKINSENLEFEKYAMKIGKSRVKFFKLDMKLNSVVSVFDRTKLIFFFTSNGRVDFRKYVKNLVSIFKIRVEMHQIGSRDEAKILSGIGVCGREFCCSSYLNKFNHVSIKMAKIQNLSLNPRKISGCCGKLMCCLQHEHQAYIKLNSESFSLGTKVLTPLGEGVVIDRVILMGEFKVKLNDSVGANIKIFKFNQLKKIK